MPKREFQDESVVRTDEQQDPASRYSTSEKAFDAAHPEVQGDPKATLPGQPKRTTTHTEVTRTDEQEKPGEAVRDSYTDA